MLGVPLRTEHFTLRITCAIQLEIATVFGTELKFLPESS
jgi:hypothetical protein